MTWSWLHRSGSSGKCATIAFLFCLVVTCFVAFEYLQAFADDQLGPQDGTQVPDCTPSVEILDAIEKIGWLCLEKDEHGIPLKRGEFKFELFLGDGDGRPKNVELVKSNKTKLSELNCIANAIREFNWPKLNAPCNSFTLQRGSEKPPFAGT